MKGLKNSVPQFFKKNSSTILTGLSIVGTITTAVVAVKATPKALALLDIKRKEEDSDLTTIQIVTTVAPAYLPAAAIGLSTIGCICGIGAFSKKQQASIASAYMFVEKSYKQYKDKVNEVFGEGSSNRVIDAIAQEKVKNVNIEVVGSFDVCRLEEDDDNTPRLFYDELSERYFESTLSKVISAEYHLNRNFIIRGSAYLNELYSFLGLTETEEGNLIGWDCEDMISNAGIEPWIDFNHRKVAFDDGLICYMIEIPYPPTMAAMDAYFE